MEVERAAGAATEADEGIGGDTMERAGMKGDGESEDKTLSLLEKKKEEEERVARLLDIRRRTLAKRFRTEKVHKLSR
ncbi:hypothetical protein AALO_G00096600 [Alosa alosa]|uniref:Uncharacterized protein n=1 Tax=Alosa alosa TaxID=278164 RepID=A0AAV6GWW0_9TELE|nr:hypothetical protein AALO_G00096600 [Alosa alosa]